MYMHSSKQSIRALYKIYMRGQTLSPPHKYHMQNIAQNITQRCTTRFGQPTIKCTY
jgi:hypothetical protein